MRRFLALKNRDMVLITATAMFMAQLDGSVMIVALPSIARDFGLPTVSLSFAVTIYLTMLVAILPISGWAADRFGPRRVFLTATAGFAIFSIGCALSDSFWPFILSRALQGACAALMTPVGRLILLRQTDKSELVDALSITAMAMLIAPTLGPSIGGFIVDYGRWEYIFLINVPISALLLIAGRLRIPDLGADPSLRLDAIGALLLSGGLLAALSGFDRLVGGLAAPLPWLLIAAGVGAFAIGVRHIRRQETPLISFEAMRHAGFRSATIGASAIMRIPGRALLFALPLMFQLGFGFSPFEAGLLLIAINGADFLTKPWIKPSLDRFGFRRTVVFASLAGVVAIALFAVARPGPLLLPVLIAGLFLAGAARSFVFTSLTALAFSTLNNATMTSGNVLASISMQAFNTLAVSITAVTLSLFARVGDGAEPGMADYRFTLVVIAAIGVAATLAARRLLPPDLKDIGADLDR